MTELRVKGVSGFDLFAHRCSNCGEFQVDGFWNQLEHDFVKEQRRVYTRMSCRKCGHVHVRTNRLTTERPRPKWINWCKIGLIPLERGWIPPRFRGYWISWIMWLERKIPL